MSTNENTTRRGFLAFTAGVLTMGLGAGHALAKGGGGGGGGGGGAAGGDAGIAPVAASPNGPSPNASPVSRGSRGGRGRGGTVQAREENCSGRQGRFCDRTGFTRFN